jgi:hypothetical protein
MRKLFEVETCEPPQACNDQGSKLVIAEVYQDGDFGGAEIRVGTMVVYVTHDDLRGATVSIWRNFDPKSAPDIIHEFPLPSIGL